MRRFFPRPSHARVQTLEPRTFLAAHAFFEPDSGLLHVIGDDTDDRIDVSLQFGVDGPPPVLGTLVTVRDHGREIFRGYFLDSQLSEVRITGGFGDDRITVANDDSPIATLVFADAGNDAVDAFVARRAAPPRIYAGEGDDLVTLAARTDARDGYVVLGAGGDDTINGSSLNDVLFGDNESVSPVSIPGNDVIRGGGGNDALYGGMGDDELFGGDGNDSLDGGAGSDFIDGGAGTDQAMIDAFDKFQQVEQPILT